MAPAKRFRASHRNADGDAVINYVYPYTDIPRLPIRILSDILFRACGGCSPELILLSTVSRRFKAAIAGFQSSHLFDLNIFKTYPDDLVTAHFSKAISFTPRLKKIVLGSYNYNGTYHIPPQSIVAWSDLIGQTLKSLSLIRCKVTCQFVSALSKMKSLETLRLTHCSFDYSHEEMADCDAVTTVKTLEIYEQIFYRSLESLLNCFPRLEHFKYYDAQWTPVCNLNANYLTSLEIQSTAKAFNLTAPNLMDLHLVVFSVEAPHFTIRNVFNLRRFKVSGRRSSEPLSSKLIITMEPPLPSRLDHLDALGPSNQALFMNLLKMNAKTLLSLTFQGSLPSTQGMSRFPCVQKIFVTGAPMDKKLIEKVKVWLGFCPSTVEVKLHFEEGDSNAAFAFVKDMAWLRSLFPRISFICPWD